MGREADADRVPAELRNVLRQRRELHQHIGLVGIDDQLPAALSGRLEAGDQAIDVLTGGDDRNQLVWAATRQLDELLLDVDLAAQAMGRARRAQRRALAAAASRRRAGVCRRACCRTESPCAREPGGRPCRADADRRPRPAAPASRAPRGLRGWRSPRGRPVQRLARRQAAQIARQSGVGKNTRPTSSTAIVPSLPYTGIAGWA